MKVMQSMENKLMKAIKEVNESEVLSTDSSPVNSPNIGNQTQASTTSSLKTDRTEHLSSITVTETVLSGIHSVTRLDYAVFRNGLYLTNTERSVDFRLCNFIFCTLAQQQKTA